MSLKRTHDQAFSVSYPRGSQIPHSIPYCMPYYRTYYLPRNHPVFMDMRVRPMQHVVDLTILDKKCTIEKPQQKANIDSNKEEITKLVTKLIKQKTLVPCDTKIISYPEDPVTKVSLLQFSIGNKKIWLVSNTTFSTPFHSNISYNTWRSCTHLKEKEDKILHNVMIKRSCVTKKKTILVTKFGVEKICTRYQNSANKTHKEYVAWVRSTILPLLTITESNEEQTDVEELNVDEEQTDVEDE